ncbi:hypothetical protein [Enterobacter hormaechei]|uniref:hypothetical protein n=1 Tax=Enterobacter hormaechei TaxID=158836 RepID=UPI00297B545E|nr:hypothetical protein [Enterobacter cloacae]HAS1149796.1 hypothetical protein [Enterobacter cloacae]HAV2196900.1 hypothetical protein [Enterobacter cloacae]
MSDEKSKTILQTGLEIAADRIKNNFYGYLITSFLIFNWENIILILKSKNDIEMTLLYISVQPNFADNFLWQPLKVGIMASFIMPAISTIYSLIVGIITAFRDKSREIGKGLMDAILAAFSTFVRRAQLNAGKLAEQVRSEKRELNSLRERIATSLEQKARLDQYLLSIARSYAQNPNLNDEKDLENIFKALYHEGLKEFYTPENMIGSLIYLVEEHNKATAQEIVDSQSKVSNPQTEK